VVVGGGITGAGVFAEAARAGARTLLVEQRDFAWGTSSRSSKLVHGGLRYLGAGQVRLAWLAVSERESLLRNAPGLVAPLGFLLATFAASDRGAGRTTSGSRCTTCSPGAGSTARTSRTTSPRSRRTSTGNDWRAGSASATRRPTTRGWCCA
jgi:glycerol-3-phosphate dehydrogenase